MSDDGHLPTDTNTTIISSSSSSIVLDNENKEPIVVKSESTEDSDTSAINNYHNAVAEDVISTPPKSPKPTTTGSTNDSTISTDITNPPLSPLDTTDTTDDWTKLYENHPLTNIKEPHNNDVLYGRGGGTNHHPGNKRYRKLVEERKVEYVNSKRLEKPLVALGIIRSWRRNQNPPGRFLKHNDKTGGWDDVGDKKAREKTSQALREKAPVLRRQQEEINEENSGGGSGISPKIGGGRMRSGSRGNNGQQQGGDRNGGYGNQQQGSIDDNIPGLYDDPESLIIENGLTPIQLDRKGTPVQQVEQQQQQVVERRTRFASDSHPGSGGGGGVKPSSKLKRPSFGARIHSLGTEVPDQSLAGFSWDDPVTEIYDGKQNNGNEPLDRGDAAASASPPPPSQVNPPMPSPPAGIARPTPKREWSLNSVGSFSSAFAPVRGPIPVSNQSSRYGNSPPESSPMDDVNQHDRFHGRHNRGNSNNGNMSLKDTFSNIEPAPMTGRNHSLDMNPLPHSNVVEPVTYNNFDPQEEEHQVTRVYGNPNNNSNHSRGGSGGPPVWNEAPPPPPDNIDSGIDPLPLALPSPNLSRENSVMSQQSQHSGYGDQQQQYMDRPHPDSHPRRSPTYEHLSPRLDNSSYSQRGPPPQQQHQQQHHQQHQQQQQQMPPESSPYNNSHYPPPSKQRHSYPPSNPKNKIDHRPPRHSPTHYNNNNNDQYNYPPPTSSGGRPPVNTPKPRNDQHQRHNRMPSNDSHDSSPYDSSPYSPNYHQRQSSNNMEYSPSPRPSPPINNNNNNSSSSTNQENDILSMWPSVPQSTHHRDHRGHDQNRNPQTTITQPRRVTTGIPKPKMVKRNTSNQNEETSVKKDTKIRRSFRGGGGGGNSNTAAGGGNSNHHHHHVVSGNVSVDGDLGGFGNVFGGEDGGGSSSRRSVGGRVEETFVEDDRRRRGGAEDGSLAGENISDVFAKPLPLNNDQRSSTLDVDAMTRELANEENISWFQDLNLAT